MTTIFTFIDAHRWSILGRLVGTSVFRSQVLFFLVAIPFGFSAIQSACGVESVKPLCDVVAKSGLSLDTSGDVLRSIFGLILVLATQAACRVLAPPISIDFKMADSSEYIASNSVIQLELAKTIARNWQGRHANDVKQTLYRLLAKLDPETKGLNEVLTASNTLTAASKFKNLKIKASDVHLMLAAVRSINDYSQPYTRLWISCIFYLGSAIVLFPFARRLFELVVSLTLSILGAEPT